MIEERRVLRLFHFCRMQMPRLALARATFEKHLQRVLELHQTKNPGIRLESFLDSLHTLDWYLCCGCLEGVAVAWELLFATRASRVDCLLIDALRARSVRLFPRDEERQEEAVNDFWGYLLAGERPGSLPILARYDGQRPLIPWLIRVFQNKHISDLRGKRNLHALPEDALDERDLPFPMAESHRWHEEFREAAREWVSQVKESDLLLLGLRLRYRLSQREAASHLGIHEGNVSRQTTRLRDSCLDFVGKRLNEAGWTGEDLSAFILKEMDSLLLEEPRLSADALSGILAKKQKALPV